MITPMVWEALGWGALAASSLVIGALLGVARRWPSVLMGCVLGFGAGALIASVSFELASKGVQLAGERPVAIGLAIGAVTFFAASRGVERLGAQPGQGGAGLPLALGALLDGIPEQAVLGMGLARGDGVSVALLAAVFISNLPEGVGSSAALTASGWSRRSVILLWVGLGAVCTVATVGGNLLADVAHPPLEGAVNGFAAGAVLVMLANSMIPEAQENAKNWAGLTCVLGFAVAAALSQVTS